MDKIRKPKHGSQAWLELRWRDAAGRCTFGASDAAALLNLSPYTTAGELYYDKITPPAVQPDNPVFERGNALEPALITWAAGRLGIELSTPDWMYQRGRFTVSLDAVDNPEQPTLIVECKTTTKYAVRSADDLPDEWLAQAAAQRWVTGAPVMFAVLDKHLSMSLIELPADEWYGLPDLLAAADKLGELVDSGTAPDDATLSWLDAQQLAQLFPAEGATVELDDESYQWVIELAQARDDKATAEKREKHAKDTLALILKGADTATYGGEKLITWKEQRGRESLDTARLKADHPELVAQYTKPAGTMRVFRTYVPLESL